MPAEFIDHIDKQDFVITLKNESYIQLDGSENFDATRGIKPHFVVADEYADFHPGWHIAMKPNLLAHRAALLMMGTPPEFPVLADGESHHYCLMDVECQNRMKQQKKVFWLKATSFDNPRIDPAELEEEKERLFARGEAYVWEREYMAEIVAGSNLRIFPMFSATRHYEKQPGSILKKIQDDPDRYEFWCGADPATKSTFAVLFIAIDRYTATPYFLDEIYEKDQSYTIASRINPLVVERCKKIAPEHPWSYICDEAAASFMEESANLPDCPIYWNPTCKQLHDKQSGIQLFKTILLEREQIISAECEHFGSELLNYQTNYRGLTVKLHDHLIDICRYVLREANFTLRQSDYFKQVEEDPEENNYLISVAEWEHRQRTKEDLFYELVM